MALFTFFVADFNIGNSFVGVNIMQKMDAGIDEYNFYINSGVAPEVAKEFFPIRVDGQKKYLYYHINESVYFGFSSSDTLAFSVRYPVA